MKKNFVLALIYLLPIVGNTQEISITDFNNFLNMRDSVMACPDSIKQVAFVHRLYIDKASEGLQAFMRNKDGLDLIWRKLILDTPSFWDSIANRRVLILRASKLLESNIHHLYSLYPSAKPAKTFYLVGIRQQGGTIRGSVSLVGTEVVCAAPGVTEKSLVRMGMHEFIHTQQVRPDFQKIDVLTSSIREGACDFIATLVTGIPVDEPYTRYGRKHELEVWQSFQKEMYSSSNDNWVSTGNNPLLPAPDLGYFIGYRICEAYYKKATDKRKALADIIELDYSRKDVVSNFLMTSAYDGK